MTWKSMAVIGVTILGLALGASGGARADLITNGGFETLTNGIGQLGTNTEATGWSVPGGSTNSYAFVFDPSTATSTGAPGQYGAVSLIGPGNGTSNGLGASPAGGNFLGSDGDFQQNPGTISQSISGLTVGQTYALSFYWAAAQQFGFSGATTSGWQVTLGSSAAQSTGLIDPGSKSFSGWMATTMDFTATSTTETLSFLAQATGGAALPPFSLLDGVTLNAVPEPSSALIVGVGLLAFGAFGAVKNRRRASSVAV